MSRIGLKPIPVPANVTITVDGTTVRVKGPKGELHEKLAREISVVSEEGKLTLSRPNNARRNRSQHGLARTLISNMIVGVTDGHLKVLEIHGVGYRAQTQGKQLVLSVGYSHEVRLDAPEGVNFEVSAEERGKQTEIKVSGINKALVGQVAADVRKVRKPDPYKGKGLRYKGERVKLRPGKRAATA
jgi:large subunit ribosomal protein L6